MLKDSIDYLAIFDGFHSTRDELLQIQTAIDDRAKAIGQSAADIAGVVKLWHTDIKKLGTTIGRDVHTNGYVALEKYVNDLHESSVVEVRAIVASFETKFEHIAATQHESFHRHLKDIAATANGLPLFPCGPFPHHLLEPARTTRNWRSFACVVSVLRQRLSPP
ncbi:hypothetical protein ACW9YV_14790 (plasmid) [Paraburkholderia strydomiana]